jgi:NADH:ubiquinone oxidoreductase subunit F (NADH-binding)
MSSTAVQSRRKSPQQALPRLLTDIRTNRPLALSEHVASFGPLTLPRDLIHELAEAGLRGRGGGAFPTADKLRAVAKQRGRPVVVVNAAEGEPASSKDRALLRLTPHLVLDGAVAAAGVLGAREVVVGVAENARSEHATLMRAAAERRRHDRVDLEIRAVPDAFVTGEETALLRALEGGPAKPTLKPPYPFERGLGHAPTLVLNAETSAHVALIARFGSAWFRSAGTADAPGTALVTLNGAVNRPGVHEIELGSTLGELMLRLGGTSEPVSAFLAGGYFGGFVSAADAPSFRLTPDTLGAGAIVAFPERACAVGETARIARYLAGESAGQCGPCVFGLDAIATALEQLALGHRSSRGDKFSQLTRWTQQVRGRGACRHPDGAARFVDSALTVFAADFEQHARHGRCKHRHRAVLPL